MKRSQPRRDWSDARAKVDREGACRVCGTSADVEAAHVTERAHDGKPTLRGPGPFRRSLLYVHPDRIIPLCGPFPAGCHGAEHRHELDTLPLLTLDEQLQAVADCGGIEQARIRTCPSQHRSGADERRSAA